MRGDFDWLLKDQRACAVRVRDKLVALQRRAA